MDDIVQFAVDGFIEELEKILLYDKSILNDVNSVKVSHFSVKELDDCNLICQDGWTPLCGASIGGQKDVASLLIEAGASVNVQDNVF